MKIVTRACGDMTVLDITIREGKNSQVRRMFARLGHKVRDLTRVRMGPLTLEGLSVGAYRNLSPREVAQFAQVRYSRSGHGRAAVPAR